MESVFAFVTLWKYIRYVCVALLLGSPFCFSNVCLIRFGDSIYLGFLWYLPTVLHGFLNALTPVFCRLCLSMKLLISCSFFPLVIALIFSLTIMHCSKEMILFLPFCSQCPFSFLLPCCTGWNDKYYGKEMGQWASTLCPALGEHMQCFIVRYAINCNYTCFSTSWGSPFPVLLAEDMFLHEWMLSFVYDHVSFLLLEDYVS